MTDFRLPAALQLPGPTTDALSEQAQAYLAAALAPATRRAYQSDLKQFLAWCLMHQTCPMPAVAKTVADFLAAQAVGTASVLDPVTGRLISGPKWHPTTLERRVAAIRYAHYRNGIDPAPTESAAVKDVMRGIRKAEGRPAVKKKALTQALLVTVIDRIPDSLTGLRDRALLLLGFAGAFRRSELVAVEVKDLCFERESVPREGGPVELEVLRVTVTQSKTDQESQGFVKPILPGAAYCPVQAVKAWLAAAKISEGSVFRRMHRSGAVTSAGLSAQSVALIIKKYAEAAGLDPALFAGHSLRRGFITSADQAGARLSKIKQVTGQSVPVLVDYIEEAEAFRDHAGEGLL